MSITFDFSPDGFLITLDPCPLMAKGGLQVRNLESCQSALAHYLGSLDHIKPGASVADCPLCNFLKGSCAREDA